MYTASWRDVVRGDLFGPSPDPRDRPYRFVIRLALVVFRLVGLPVLHRLGGCVAPPPEPRVRARLSRQVASAGGRLDVVQVRLSSGTSLDAEPILGHSALLSLLAAADGYVVVPEAATGLAAGTEVMVTLYR